MRLAIPCALIAALALVGPVSAQTSHSANETLPVAVPAAPGACQVGADLTVTFTVGSGVSIADVQLELDLDHTWHGDLEFDLTSPVGTTCDVKVAGCQGGVDDSSDFASTAQAGTYILADGMAQTLAAAAQAAGAEIPIGIYGPDNPLAVFGGENPVGTWTFIIRDWFVGDLGNLNGATLTITEGAAPTVWQLNSADASVDVNGVQNTSMGPTTVVAAIGSTNTLSYGSVQTSLYDLGVQANAPAAGTGPGASTPNFQAVNLDLGQPIYFLSSAGGTTPNPGTWGGGSTSINFALGGGPQRVCVQGLWINPANPDGVSLSQAADFQTEQPAVCGGTSVSPGDDSAHQVTLLGTVNFYGVAYTDIWCNSNGNMTFGAGDTDFSQSVSELLDQEPRIAPVWDDLSPNVAGDVTASDDGTTFACEWLRVPQFGTAGDENTFCVSIDYATGTISCDYGYNTGDDGIAGISPGGGAAGASTDLSGANSGGPTDAIFEEFNSGNPRDLGSGRNTTNVTYTPNAAGGYDAFGS